MTINLDMNALTQIAIAAGEAILKIYGEAIDVSEKGDGSPVTQADTAAEAIILKGLADLSPDIAVVAEESVAAGCVPPPSARFFLVDPLDGTREFISKNGEFTVNIGLVEDGVPVAGVVYAPALGDIFWGSKGEGARRAKVVEGKCGPGPAEEISVRMAPKEGLTVLASRSHMSAETSDFAETLSVAELISAGSSLKFCRVAEGGADLYPRFGRMMEWDTAAADAVLRAAGGLVITTDGAPLSYGKRNLPHDSDFANPYFIAVGDREIVSSLQCPTVEGAL
ncbi:3'(2'),5'-bisphosphate nucleotidase CysQ [Breoghania sp.]|uniref:3'(2'),5'-bisphosphate nucleotidase CysQ n=1 Tax=Breoghania sp. TaxID=2065378 RepID=UPI0026295C68|nr:3'(2'),5'-bisphosphate nucleotidase CysQ [Breoghania sp.]MDJ0932768.1 3'(2'),5'-bisphosphate nucleotidase CysQ [Breoghania sp.]